MQRKPLDAAGLLGLTTAVAERARQYVMFRPNIVSWTESAILFYYNTNTFGFGRYANSIETGDRRRRIKPQNGDVPPRWGSSKVGRSVEREFCAQVRATNAHTVHKRKLAFFHRRWPCVVARLYGGACMSCNSCILREIKTQM